MSTELVNNVVQTFKSASRKLTGWKRREFQAEVVLMYCKGNSRKAERVFGWGRDAVEKRLNEKRTSNRCLDNV